MMVTVCCYYQREFTFFRKMLFWKELENTKSYLLQDSENTENTKTEYTGFFFSPNKCLKGEKLRLLDHVLWVIHTGI